MASLEREYRILCLKLATRHLHGLQAWLRHQQGNRSLLIDDVAEQGEHVEYQKTMADAVEDCSGGMEDGGGKMKKKGNLGGESFM